jgi:hypothetical protein
VNEPKLDENENHFDQDFDFHQYYASGGEDTSQHNTVLDGWDSIPWTVPCEPPQRAQPIDYQLTEEIRENNRQHIATSQNDKWNEIMPKLFAVYLWLKEQTKNWTCARSSFTLFVHVFCECQPTNIKSRQWIDCVDVVGQYSTLFPCWVSLLTRA